MSVQSSLCSLRQGSGRVPAPITRRLPFCVAGATLLDLAPVLHAPSHLLQVRLHQRLIDIKDLSSQTVDKLMSLDLPAGVDVEVGAVRV